MKNLWSLHLLILTLFLLIIASGCQKSNSYFQDTGKHNAKYDGNILQYLQNHKYHQFDSLVKVIKLAGMEQVVENETITFFAPADTTIMKSVEFLNETLLREGKDTVSNLSQLKPAFWKKQLSMYIFKGIKRLSDYPQIDPGATQVFPGQYYESYGGKIMHIGVVFNYAGGVQYAGYRQLMIKYFSGSIPPVDNWSYLNLVASSDINPTNGIIHALQYSNLRTSSGSGLLNTLFFGFNAGDFVTDARQIGLEL